MGKFAADYLRVFSYERVPAKVLDVGCGQGRDALFIARLGHFVNAVDLSPTGISDIRKDAEAEGLNILTEVVDIRKFRSRRRFDVIVIDRTLHMLTADDRLAVLDRLLGLSRPGSHILIADQRSNLPAFKTILSASRWSWTTTLERRGFLFVRRD